MSINKEIGAGEMAQQSLYFTGGQNPHIPFLTQLLQTQNGAAYQKNTTGVDFVPYKKKYDNITTTDLDWLPKEYCNGGATEKFLSSKIVAKLCGPFT